MFCYHCGAKLPDEAKFCFACGMKLIIGNESANPPEPLHETAASPQNRPVRNAGKKYEIGEYTLTFSGDDARYIKCNQLLEQYFWDNLAAYDVFVKEEIKTFDDFVEKLIPKLNIYIQMTVGIGVETLLDNHVDDIDEKNLMDMLMERRPLERGLEDLFKACAQVEEYARQLNIEAGSGMRFTGGGFGITGAISGALKAEALNMGMDAVSGIAKWATGNTDNDKMRRFKEQRFNELHGEFELQCFSYWCGAVAPLVTGILTDEGIMGRADFDP